MKKILVIGSLNVDFCIVGNKIPMPSETVNADKLIINNGGKGANQAYTIGILGGNVSMLGAVGDDIYGKDLKESLKKVNVNTDNINEIQNEDTGKAFINVDYSGQNSISIIHGANYKVTSEFILKNKQLIDEADIILLQLEIPLDTVKTILECAKGKTIIIDPAPATKEFMNLDLTDVYLIKPNESELSVLANTELQSKESIEELAKELLKKGVKNVVVSLGGNGSCLINKEKTLYFNAKEVPVKDTTAAGDSFIASVCLKLSQNKSLEESIEFATLVSSLVVQKNGAQSSIPNLMEVEKYEKNNN